MRSVIASSGQLLTWLIRCAVAIIPLSSQLMLQRMPWTVWNATNTPRQRYGSVKYTEIVLWFKLILCQGRPRLKKAIADAYSSSFGRILNPETEVTITTGANEGESPRGSTSQEDRTELGEIVQACSVPSWVSLSPATRSSFLSHSSTSKIRHSPVAQPGSSHSDCEFLNIGILAISRCLVAPFDMCPCTRPRMAQAEPLLPRSGLLISRSLKTPSTPRPK